MTKVVKPNFSNTELAKNYLTYVNASKAPARVNLENKEIDAAKDKMHYRGNKSKIELYNEKPKGNILEYKYRKNGESQNTGATESKGVVSRIYSLIIKTAKPVIHNVAGVIEGKIESIFDKLGISHNDTPETEIGLVDYSPENNPLPEEATTVPNEVEVAHDHGGGEPASDISPEPTTKPVTETSEETTEPTTKEETTKEETTKEEAKPSTEHKHFDIPLSNEEQDIVYECAEKYGLDPAIVFGVIEQESSFNKNIGVNSYNCAGLMQLNLTYSQPYGVTYDNYSDVYTNVNGGCMLCNNSLLLETGLMAYNYGEYGAKKQWNQGNYTSSYSRGVMAKAEKYR